MRFSRFFSLSATLSDPSSICASAACAAVYFFCCSRMRPLSAFICGMSLMRPEGQFLRLTCHSMHWVLDVAFREDDCRIRIGEAAQNFAVLRRMALNLLKNDK